MIALAAKFKDNFYATIVNLQFKVAIKIVDSRIFIFSLNLGPVT